MVHSYLKPSSGLSFEERPRPRTLANDPARPTLGCGSCANRVLSSVNSGSCAADRLGPSRATFVSTRSSGCSSALKGGRPKSLSRASRVSSHGSRGSCLGGRSYRPTVRCLSIRSGDPHWHCPPSARTRQGFRSGATECKLRMQPPPQPTPLRRPRVLGLCFATRHA